MSAFFHQKTTQFLPYSISLRGFLLLSRTALFFRNQEPHPQAAASTADHLCDEFLFLHSTHPQKIVLYKKFCETKKHDRTVMLL